MTDVKEETHSFTLIIKADSVERALEHCEQWLDKKEDTETWDAMDIGYGQVLVFISGPYDYSNDDEPPYISLDEWKRDGNLLEWERS